MIDSYRNISFYGEKRGEQEFNYYSQLLAEDLKTLQESGSTGNYEQKFIEKLMAFFHSQSNCASAFIVGPARFNNRRAEKLWTWRDNKMDHFEHWRKKYFKAVNRVRTLSPEAEIDVAIERLEYLETEKAKGRESRVNPEKEFCKVYNVTTKIREAKKKIEVMKMRIEAKANFKPIEFKGGQILLENDRVIVKHDEKPERTIIDAIKSHGFRYSPKFKQWVRKHTGRALYDAEMLVKNHLGGAL